jgi:hypothetical protein
MTIGISKIPMNSSETDKTVWVDIYEDLYIELFFIILIIH